MSYIRKIRVALVEDEIAQQALVRELLDNDCPDKFEIVCANTMKNALDLLVSQKFDIVLTDLDLPDTSELNIVKEVQKINPEIPIVVLTGKESDELAMQVVQLGAQDYLVKGRGDGYLISRSLRYAIERKRIERGLSFLTQYDGLTGLANRVLFRERLSRALIRAHRNEKLVALMFIDLDRFKNVNDTLGHDAGDQLLVEIGGRLKDILREGDTIARLGGDEFTVILEDIEKAEDAAIIARKILDIMKAAVSLDGHDVFVTPSIGITIYPLDDTSEDILLRNADTAMYRAKEQGRNGFQFYTTGMNTRTVERLELESKLRKALDNDEFLLYYQPKIDLGNGQLIGAEALIRWQHPELGMVSPADFIPLAEETGLIVPIGEWVIKTACAEAGNWERQGFHSLRTAVNLSARQFSEVDIVRLIIEAVISSSISPLNLEVEITESMLMEDTDISNAKLKELKGHGIHVSVDDFGTGYSSLSYLKRFHIDTLKIDQSFVRDITYDPDDAAIASAIIALGKNLRLNVVAEGVETEEQLKFLQAHGCSQAQGYYFSRPLCAKDFIELLKKQAAYRTEYPIKQSA